MIVYRKFTVRCNKANTVLEGDGWFLLNFIPIYIRIFVKRPWTE